MRRHAPSRRSLNRLRHVKGPIMKRSASAVWKGGLKDGRGTVSTESGTVSNVPYTFRMRFENEKGTNPEELIAAAHAACFSMALSLFVADEGGKTEWIGMCGAGYFEKGEGDGSVTRGNLEQTRVSTMG